MARMPERSGVQPGIIVGVDAGPLSRRSRDYTPRADPSVGLGRGPGTRHPTGGADAFLTFLAARIKPLVEGRWRSEEHTSELQSLMRISYAVFCLKKKKKNDN